MADREVLWVAPSASTHWNSCWPGSSWQRRPEEAAVLALLHRPLARQQDATARAA